MTKPQNSSSATSRCQTWVWLMLLLPILGVGCAADPRSGNGSTAAEGQAIEIPSTIDVEVTQPGRQELVHEITLPGSVEPFEKTILYSKVGGYLECV